MIELGAVPVLTLSRQRTGVHADSAGRQALAREFAAARRLKLPGLLSPDVLEMALTRLRSGRFRERVASRVHPPAVDWKLDDGNLHGFLQFLLNDPDVLAFVRDVSGESAIRGFVGAVYRLVPRRGHRDSWHDDMDGNRLVALTVNLSERPFEGGELEMRDVRTGRVLWQVANVGAGDGLLFALAPNLKHRIRPVRGAVEKTALAGWFCRDADRRV